MAKNIIGFWGYIEPEIVKEYKTLYPNALWVDLDVGYNYPEIKILPDAYCKIIKNIFDNAFYLKDELIIILAPIGKDKCDSGFFASELLKDYGFCVHQLKCEKTIKNGEIINTPICKSGLPLKEKIERITAEIITDKTKNLEEVKPKFGFWGVPPHDLSILELFPDETHVFGWLKCVEAGYPSDINLEMQVDENLPTVFFAQTFCSKNQLAKHLASKYQGLYIDIDGLATNSAKAKIEAFLRLRR